MSDPLSTFSQQCPHLYLKRIRFSQTRGSECRRRHLWHTTRNRHRHLYPHRAYFRFSAGARRSHADDIVDGDMYAINHNGQLRVKLVYLKKG